MCTAILYDPKQCENNKDKKINKHYINRIIIATLFSVVVKVQNKIVLRGSRTYVVHDYKHMITLRSTRTSFIV